MHRLFVTKRSGSKVGATTVEYALLTGLSALAIVAGVIGLDQVVHG